MIAITIRFFNCTKLCNNFFHQIRLHIQIPYYKLLPFHGVFAHKILQQVLNVVALIRY